MLTIKNASERCIRWFGVACLAVLDILYSIPVNQNPPRATLTHLTHLYLTLPYHTRVVWGAGARRGVKSGLGVLRVVWGVSVDQKRSCYSPVPKLLNCTKWPRELKTEKYFNDIFKPDKKCFSQACSKID